MINHVYLLLVNADWCYSDTIIDTEIFYTKEDAGEYMDIYKDTIINDIWEDNSDYYEGNRERFDNDIEVNKSDNHIYIYLEDVCYIDLDIIKKDIMSM